MTVPYRNNKGSAGIELLGWGALPIMFGLSLLLPLLLLALIIVSPVLLVFSLWRRSGKVVACRSCRGTNVVPTASARARKDVPNLDDKIADAMDDAKGFWGRLFDPT